MVTEKTFTIPPQHEILRGIMERRRFTASDMVNAFDGASVNGYLEWVEQVLRGEKHLEYAHIISLTDTWQLTPAERFLLVIQLGGFKTPLVSEPSILLILHALSDTALPDTLRSLIDGTLQELAKHIWLYRENLAEQSFLEQSTKS